MREKYESLSAAALKELAKARGIKYVSTMTERAGTERNFGKAGPERCHRRE